MRDSPWQTTVRAASVPPVTMAAAGRYRTLRCLRWTRTASLVTRTITTPASSAGGASSRGTGSVEGRATIGVRPDSIVLTGCFARMRAGNVHTGAELALRLVQRVLSVTVPGMAESRKMDLRSAPGHQRYSLSCQASGAAPCGSLRNFEPSKSVLFLSIP